MCNRCVKVLVPSDGRHEIMGVDSGNANEDPAARTRETVNRTRNVATEYEATV